MSKRDTRRYVIQIERPNETLDIGKAQTILDSTGVEIDTSYGPICVNPKRGRYVVRGLATPRAKSRAEKIEGVTFYQDARIAPAR